jgi:hypothetical protein
VILIVFLFYVLYHLYHDYIALIAGLRIRIHCLRMDQDLNVGQAFLKKSLGSKSNLEGQNAAFCKKIVKLSKILGSFLTVSNCNVFSHGEKGKNV